MPDNSVLRMPPALQQRSAIGLFDWLGVVICFVTSSTVSFMITVLLGVVGLAAAFNRRHEMPVELSKEERRLTFSLPYYLGLHGLDMVEYTVTTSDGFNLQLRRIIDPTENSEQRAVRYPVLCVHGLLQSSEAYCTSGEQSIAISLFRAGYDVWLGNNRCGFKPSHKRYSKWDPRMWQWSLKDMAYKDLPCLVDFVRHSTLSSKIALVGHSQGSSQTLIALARDGIDLGPKLSCFCALSPAVYKGPILDRWYFKIFRHLPWPVYRLGFGHMAFVSAFNAIREHTPVRVYSFYGFMVFSTLFDWGDKLWNPRYRYRNFVFVPTYVSAELMYFWLGPGGISSSGCMFNESLSSWYDSETTPPMIMFCPGKDNLVLPEPFINRLQTYENLKRLEVVYLPNYSHLDVLWACDVDRTIVEPMAKFIWSNVDDKQRWSAVRVEQNDIQI